MKTFHRFFVTCAAVISGAGLLFTATTPVQAAPDSLSQLVRPATDPLAGVEQPVYVREVGPGNAVIAEQLQKKLRQIVDLSNPGTPELSASRWSVAGRTWYMAVYDGGNTFRYLQERPTQHRIPISSKPSQKKVLEDGKRVLATVLSEIIQTSANEQIVPVAVKGEFDSSQPTDGSQPPTVELAGWTAIFGRVVDGSLVVGGGSRIAISFDVRGDVTGILVDWPHYKKTDARVKIVSKSEALRRAAMLEAIPTQPMVKKREKLDCGLLDPGGRHNAKRSRFLQPGCLYAVEWENANLPVGGTESTATLQAIPTAVKPIQDSWTKSVLLP